MVKSAITASNLFQTVRSGFEKIPNPRRLASPLPHLPPTTAFRSYSTTLTPSLWPLKPTSPATWFCPMPITPAGRPPLTVKQFPSGGPTTPFGRFTFRRVSIQCGLCLTRSFGRWV